MVNMFGGKGAREGVTSTVAVKGNRKATMSDTTGQIIDLAEEKIYDLDIKKKTYKVTTFAELRKQMEEAQREAEKSAREEQRASRAVEARREGSQRQGIRSRLRPQEHGAARTINGFDTNKTVMTITVREKGKTLDRVRRPGDDHRHVADAECAVDQGPRRLRHAATRRSCMARR